MASAVWYERISTSVGADRLRRRLLLAAPGSTTRLNPGWDRLEIPVDGRRLPFSDRGYHVVIAEGLLHGRDRLLQRHLAGELCRIAERAIVVADRRHFPIATELCSLFPQGSRVSVLPMITTRRPQLVVAHVRSPLLSGRRARASRPTPSR